MASSYSPKWRRWLYRNCPWLFHRCGAHNHHWRWDRLCWCNDGCNGVKGPERLPLKKDLAEEAYWRFDARRNGYGPWKGSRQSERDAFKAEFRRSARSET